MSRKTAGQKPAQAVPPSPGARSEPAGATAAALQQARAAFEEASRRHPFGPAFFMTQLRGFVGEKCPDPAGGLPVVEIHLAGGEVLDLCHIIGVTPGWAALAVRETDRSGPAPTMRTEFIPFEAVVRVTVRSSRPEAPRLGFEHSRVPHVLGASGQPEMTPEVAIEVAATGRRKP